MPRKPSGRLPSDLARTRPETPRGDDLGASGHHVLNLAPLPADVRAQRNAAAVRYLYTHAPDVIEILGLAGDTREAKKPIDVACPTCEQPAGVRCKSQAGRDMAFHTPRIRITKEKVDD